MTSTVTIDEGGEAGGGGSTGGVASTADQQQQQQQQQQHEDEECLNLNTYVEEMEASAAAAAVAVENTTTTTTAKTLSPTSVTDKEVASPSLSATPHHLLVPSAQSQSQQPISSPLSFASTTPRTATPTRFKLTPRPGGGTRDNSSSILRRQSTFWPSEKELLQRHPSLRLVDNDIHDNDDDHPIIDNSKQQPQVLNPPHDCSSRKSSIMIAMMNLVATVCGGGVLTLPLAFCRAGVVPATIMMMVAASMTNYSMMLMCSTARRSASRSYSECVRKTFGQGAEIVATLLLIVLLFFVLVAYFVLVKDIWTPVLLDLFPPLQDVVVKYLLVGVGGQTAAADGDNETSDNNVAVDSDALMNSASHYVLALLILPVIFPLLLQKDLHALRHTSYVGFASAVILMAGVVHRAWLANFGDGHSSSDDGVDDIAMISNSNTTTFTNVQYNNNNATFPMTTTAPAVTRSNHTIRWVGDMEGIMFAFPIICLSFFSIYNVPLVHAALINPTLERVTRVMDGTVMLCLVLFYLVGVGGYLAVYDETRDNILLNFPLSYTEILVGRIGYGVTLMFGLPLVFLPMRQNVMALPGHLRQWQKERQNKVHKRRLQQQQQLLVETQSLLRLRDNEDDDDEEQQQERSPGQRQQKKKYYTLESFSSTTLSERQLLQLNKNVEKIASFASTLDKNKAAKTSSSVVTQQVSAEVEVTGYNSMLLGNDFFYAEMDLSQHLHGHEQHDNVGDDVNDTGAKDESPHKSQQQQVAVTRLTTFLMVVCVYVFAIAVPGVGFVWSVVGSSMSLMIGFFVPAACYLKIRTHKRLNTRAVAAILMALFSIVASIVLTNNIFSTLAP